MQPLSPLKLRSSKMNIFTVILIQPLANGLILFYLLLGKNMGLAIIGFSLFLRIALTPLTKPYMESMKKMKEHSKEIEKLKKRHQGDRQKLMKAQADFYKEKGINPGAGCLPMILQFAILIALFRVFVNVLVPNGDIVERFNALLYEPLKLSEAMEVNTKFLYLDVRNPDTIKIPSIPFGLPGPLLLLAALVQFLSAKITMPYIKEERKFAKKTPQKSDDFQTSFQASMIYTMPLMTILFGMGFPSGLALYWLLFSAFQAWQQYRASGWGGAPPWLQTLGLVKLPDSNGKTKK
ncbi:MAG: Membrane protein insertase, YidC/Oxa1 family [Candidatus Woesebacteria bacterium GW2011_GWA1_39_11b]|nr:MAG: Membrane protein insertase, YidC/Oxa1 family [Candidatus Woesebacteria bacterium GW2011_GWA1_39_11b]